MCVTAALWETFPGGIIAKGNLMRILLPVAALILALIAANASAPLSRAASPAGPSHRSMAKEGPYFVFGRKGGNIRPFTVSIALDGVVTVSGPVAAREPLTLSRDALGGLLRLAKAEKFFSLPAHIKGGQVLPDVASLYITIYGQTGPTTVDEHGAVNRHFDQLYAVLMAVAGVRIG
jgi:hypothetical protein